MDQPAMDQAPMVRPAMAQAPVAQPVMARPRPRWRRCRAFLARAAAGRQPWPDPAHCRAVRQPPSRRHHRACVPPCSRWSNPRRPMVTMWRRLRRRRRVRVLRRAVHRAGLRYRAPQGGPQTAGRQIRARRARRTRRPRPQDRLLRRPVPRAARRRPAAARDRLAGRRPCPPSKNSRPAPLAAS